MKCAVFLLALFAALSVSEGYICKCGWLYFRGHCYFFSKGKLNWFQAEGFCRKNNGYLAKINHKTESNWIKGTIANIHKHHKSAAKNRYWLGGTDKAQQGVWRWDIDFSPVSFKDWSPKQPDSKKQNCMLMWPNDGYKWDNDGCEVKRHFLCESRAFNKPSATYKV